MIHILGPVRGSVNFAGFSVEEASLIFLEGA